MWPDSESVNKVDFQASPNKNAGRTLTAEQINGLYSMSETDRQLILNEHLSAEQRIEAEQSINTIVRFKGRMEVIKAKLAPLPPPAYDKERRQLIFGDAIIPIPADTDEEKLCRALFRSGKPIKKPLEIGYALTKLGVPLDRHKNNKKISYAKRRLNDRIARATQVSDLFIITAHQIWFNEKYT